MESNSDRPQQVIAPVCALLLFAAVPIRELPPSAVLWTAPSILVAAMLIAWAAESAQFFVAQGFALAILAWLQTLAGIRRRSRARLEAAGAAAARQSHRRAAPAHRSRLAHDLFHRRCRAPAAHRASGCAASRLEPEHSVEVVGLLACMAYVAVIWWKASLNLLDAAILIAIYVGVPDGAAPHAAARKPKASTTSS